MPPPMLPVDCCLLLFPLNTCHHLHSCFMLSSCYLADGSLLLLTVLHSHVANADATSVLAAVVCHSCPHCSLCYTMVMPPMMLPCFSPCLYPPVFCCICSSLPTALLHGVADTDAVAASCCICCSFVTTCSVVPLFADVIFSHYQFACLLGNWCYQVPVLRYEISGPISADEKSELM